MASNVTRDHHSLRRNLKLNGNYISNDGGDEGISVADTGVTKISATAAGGGKSGLVIDHDYSDTTATSTIECLKIDFDQTSSTSNSMESKGIGMNMTYGSSTGGTNKMYGLYLDLNHTAGNTGQGTYETVGAWFDLSTNSNGLGDNTVGLYIKAAGGDVNVGIKIDVEAGGNALEVLSSANGNDFFTLKVEEDGETTLTTQEYGGGSTAHFNIVPDGNFSVDAVGDIALNADGGEVSFANDTDVPLKVDMATTGTAKFLNGGGDMVFGIDDGDRKLYLFDKGGEYIEGDGTDINIGVGAGGDINIPANIGLMFGDDGERIEGNSADLLIYSSRYLYLTATNAIRVDPSLAILEQSSPPDAFSQYGQLWVEADNDPHDLIFTTDSGVHIALTSNNKSLATLVKADDIAVGDNPVSIATDDGDIVFKGTSSGTDEFCTFKVDDPTGNGVIGSDNSNVPVSEILGVSNQRFRIRTQGVQQNLQLFASNSLQLAHMIQDEDYATQGTSIHRWRNNSGFTFQCSYDDDEIIDHSDDGGRIHVGMHISGFGIPDDGIVGEVLSNTQFKLHNWRTDEEMDTTDGDITEVVEFRETHYITPTIYLKNLQDEWQTGQGWQDLTQVTDQTLGSVGAGNVLAQFRGSTSGVKCMIRMRTDSAGIPSVHGTLVNAGTGYTNFITVTGAEYNNESLIDHTAVSGLALYQSVHGEGIPVGAYIGVLNPGSVANRFTIHVAGSAVNTTGGALTGQTLYVHDRVVFQDPGATSYYMILEVGYAADGLIEFGTSQDDQQSGGTFNNQLYMDMNTSNSHIVANQRMKLMSDSDHNNVIQLDADSVFLSGSAHTYKTGQDFAFVHAGDRLFLGSKGCNNAKFCLENAREDGGNDANFYMLASGMNNGSIKHCEEDQIQAKGAGFQIKTTNGNATVTTLTSRVPPAGTAGGGTMKIAPVGDLILTGDYGTKSVIAQKVLDSTAAATTTAFKVDVDRTGTITSGTDTNTGIRVDIEADEVNGATQNNIGIDVNIDSNIISGTTTSTGLDIEMGGTSGGTSKSIGINVEGVGADTYYSILTDGPVGICVSTPDEDLVVGGNIKVQGVNNKIYFYDSGGEHISANASGILSIAGGAEIDLTSVIIDINATTTCTIDNTNTSNGVVINAVTSGSPISIGNATSETTVNDNLTVTGETLLSDKLKFTQSDGNEYIDSLDDGYLDIDATNAIRLGVSTGFTQLEETFSHDPLKDTGGTHDTQIDFRTSNKVWLQVTAAMDQMNLIFPAVSGNFLLHVWYSGDWAVGDWKVWESDLSAATNADVMWPSGTQPDNTSGGKDVFSFYWDATNQLCYGVASLAFAAP